MVAQRIRRRKADEHPADHIRHNVVVDAVTGCWIWPGSRIRSGHGQVRISGKVYMCHRVTYDHLHPEAPLGDLFGCHHCDNPPCCNPEHIHPGTPQDNADDILSHGRRRVGDQHWRTKFLESQRDEIALAKGTAKEVGTLYGIHWNTVLKYRKEYRGKSRTVVGR